MVGIHGYSFLGILKCVLMRDSGQFPDRKGYSFQSRNARDSNTRSDCSSYTAKRIEVTMQPVPAMRTKNLLEIRCRT